MSASALMSAEGESGCFLSQSLAETLFWRISRGKDGTARILASPACRALRLASRSVFGSSQLFGLLYRRIKLVEVIPLHGRLDIENRTFPQPVAFLPYVAVLYCEISR